MIHIILVAYLEILSHVATLDIIFIYSTLKFSRIGYFWLWSFHVVDQCYKNILHDIEMDESVSYKNNRKIVIVSLNVLWIWDCFCVRIKGDKSYIKLRTSYNWNIKTSHIDPRNCWLVQLNDDVLMIMYILWW